MKVLHIISGDLWAGAEVQAFTLLTTLQKRPGVTVAAALMNEGELAERLRKRNIPVTVFPENELSALSIVNGLRKLMRDWRPDVVHSHRTKENVMGAIANRLTNNVPTVRTVHGNPENNPRGLRQLHRHILYGFDIWHTRLVQQGVIAVSRDLATKLVDTFNAKQIVVIENGVDIEGVRAQVQPVTFRTQEPAAMHIGIVGRLIPLKRFDIFIDAAAILRQQHSEIIWRFHIFGDGPLKKDLQTRASIAGIGDTVTFHGHTSNAIASIAALDCLVMCSDHEGLPMTVLEAMSVATPIVAHAVGGLPDALQAYPNSVLVGEHTADAYAAAVKKVIESYSVTLPLTESSRFSAQTNATNTIKLYTNMVDKH